MSQTLYNVGSLLLKCFCFFKISLAFSYPPVKATPPKTCKNKREEEAEKKESPEIDKHKQHM